MKRVKIAQVGVGHDHAADTYRTMLGLSDLFDLVGIAEPNAAREVYPGAKRYTVEELLAMDDLEAVAIETEELLATEYAQMFADKGVAVHMDKPGSPDLAAFTRLVETLRAKNLPLHMGYMYRYNPLIHEALEQAKSGKLGDIFSVEAHMSVRHSPEKRQWLEQFPGGMMFFLGCHLIDLVLQAQGLPEEVIPYNTCTGIGCKDADDLGFAVLRYKQGVSFVKTCATEYNGFARRQLVLCGSKGTIEIKPLEADRGNTRYSTHAAFTMAAGNPQVWREGSEVHECVAHRYEAMMAAFARIVRGEPNPYTHDYELALFKTILQCCSVGSADSHC